MGNILISALAFAAVTLASTARAETRFGVEVDRLELHVGEGPEHFLFDSTFTLGTDTQGLVVKVEGGSDVGAHIDEVGAQALYARSVTDTVRVMVGAGNQFRSGEDLSFASLAVEAEPFPGLEAEHYFFLSEHGDLTGAAQLVYGVDLPAGITLEPRAALGWSAQDVPAEELASGISEFELSLRVRKQLLPALNGYIGVVREELAGGTRDIARANGDETGITRAIVGIGLEF